MTITAYREKLRQGRPCLNGWSLLPGASVAETFAQANWDSITFDLQHGLHDYASVVACLQAIQHLPIVPLVRPPSNDAAMIGRLLDAGAWGVICPMINSAAQAVALVEGCRYPPAGQRSFGPVRARADGTAPYHVVANEQILILPQIETAEAVEQLDAILGVDGVGGVYVGPSDLGFSIGLGPGLDRKEPAILAIFGKIVAAAKRHGKVAAIHSASNAYAAFAIELGFTLVTVGSDIGMLGRSAREAVAYPAARDTAPSGGEARASTY